jgi:hypothetical protein
MAHDQRRARNRKGFSARTTRHVISVSLEVSILLDTSGTLREHDYSSSSANVSRKHTGERPFQCHCSRRFSRLDNLRQHAQTVHQNEEIPQDSLAATGTRFQRQVRTDRVRPPGGRSRASTGGSQSGSVRGHHRNSLSASSVGSVASSYSQSTDIRRRPPPWQGRPLGKDTPRRFTDPIALWGNINIDLTLQEASAHPPLPPFRQVRTVPAGALVCSHQSHLIPGLRACMATVLPGVVYLFHRQEILSSRQMGTTSVHLCWVK